jgi:gamma-glutamylcyclotransferase (GGCT)/AIG2-like uncharacterized protein YtfP
MKLFVYGTLLDHVIQRNIIGRLVTGIPDLLIGYRKTVRQFSSGTYPDLVEDPASEVNGQILELSRYEMDLCDRYEGYEYCRIKIILKSGAEAFVYKS